jgi:hypothetical protein
MMPGRCRYGRAASVFRRLGNVCDMSRSLARQALALEEVKEYAAATAVFLVVTIECCC